MVSDEKDRLGDKLRDAERGREDQYFAERDRKLLEQMRQTKTKQEDVEETIRPAVPMRCPKCGGRLQQARLHDVRVETCPSCSGVWLDKSELDELGRREDDGWIARWLRREFAKPQ